MVGDKRMANIEKQENLQVKAESNKQQIDAVIKSQENLQTKVENNKQQIDAIVNKIYPIGSIYMSMNATSPSTFFGGTWQSIGAGRVLQGADDAHAAGTEIEAGLPNITGTWASRWNSEVRGFHDLTCDGAFYRVTDTSKPGRITAEDGYANNSNHNGYPCFDASKSNAIYGKSDTVQPPALAVYMWQRTA